MMFERFTDQSRRAVVLTQEEAARLDHDHIGTEHLLAGLVREERGTAADDGRPAPRAARKCHTPLVMCRP